MTTTRKTSTRNRRKTATPAKPRRDIAQEVTDRVLAAMEAGTVPWRPQYCVAGGDEMPTNHATGKAYRGANVLLLWIAAGIANHNNNRWLTYRQAEAAGGQVRRGEKGTSIVFFGAAEDKRTETPEGEPAKLFRYAKFYTVFNVAQVDGLDLSGFEPSERFEWEPIEGAERMVDGFLGRDGAPRLIYGRGTPRYSPAIDLVTLPPREHWENGPAFYQTLLHEIVHSTGHATRLNRPGIAEADRRDKVKYATEEMVAELGAAMLTARVGLMAPAVAEAASYLAGWVELLKGDKHFFMRAASAAQKAADLVAGDAGGS